MEQLEERQLLAITIPIPPVLSETFDLVSYAVSKIDFDSDQLDAFEQAADRIHDDLGGVTLAYVAFPNENNDVTVTSSLGNLFFVLNEKDSTLSITIPPAIDDDLLKDLNISLAPLGLGIEVKLFDIIGIDLPKATAITPNIALGTLFPPLAIMGDAIEGFLDMQIVPGLPPFDIGFPGIRFPEIDLGLFSFGGFTLLDGFTIIEEDSWWDGVQVRDILPDGVVDFFQGLADMFTENPKTGGVVIATMEAGDSIDLSTMTGVKQVVYAGLGADTIKMGGTDNWLEAFLGTTQPALFARPDIRLFGEGGRDTFVYNPCFNVEDVVIDGGGGNDVLLIEASGKAETIRLVSEDGQLKEIRFEVPNPTGSATFDEQQRVTLPTDTASGTFTLEFRGLATEPILHNAPASTVEDKLEALASVGTGNVSVAGPDGGPYLVTFQNALASTDFGNLIGGGNQLVISNGDPSVEVVAEADPSAGPSEVQRISIPAEVNGGTFTITFTDPSGTSRTTNPIAFDANGADVESALGALDNLQPDDISALGQTRGPWRIAFVGDQAGIDQDPLAVDSSGLTQSVRPTAEEAHRGVEPIPERQRVTIPAGATGGTFRLTFNNGTVTDTTRPIPFDASFADVQEALAELGSVHGSDNVDVEGPIGGPWTATFREELAGVEYAEMTVDNTKLEGGVNFSLATPTQGLGVNEVQQLQLIGATTGTFTVDFTDIDGVVRTTMPLPFNATASEMQTALEDLGNLGAGNVLVSKSDPSGTAWEVEFTGRMKAIDIPPLNMNAAVPTSVSNSAQGTARNEVQQVTLTGATGGGFTLTFTDNNGVSRTTSSIPHNATVAAVDMALESLSNIGAGNVRVTQPGASQWDVEFTGDFKFTDQTHLLSVDTFSLTPPTPTSPPPSASVSELVQGQDAASEVKTITPSVMPTGGTFTLTFRGETTPPLAHDASAAEIEDALETLTTVGVGNVSVTGTMTAGGGVEVEFTEELGREPIVDVDFSADATHLAGALAVSVVEVQNHFVGENELQTIAVHDHANGGNFTLIFAADTTADISHNATASAVQSALEALPSIGAGKVSVTGSAGGPWTVEFVGDLRDLASTNVPDLLVASSTVTRGNFSATVEELADGHPANELQRVVLAADTTGGHFTLTLPRDPSVQEKVPGTTSANEQQRIAVRSGITGGTFTLSFKGDTTAEIDHDASAAEVESALEALPSIGANNVAVTGPDAGPWDVEFTGALVNHDHPLLETDGASLTGGAITTANIPYSADAAAVETALEALDTIGDVRVSGPSEGPWKIEFLGEMAAFNVPTLKAQGVSLEHVGGSILVEEVTRGSDGENVVGSKTTFKELTSIESLHIAMGGDDDLLILDGIPEFPLGILYDGGDGDDRIEINSDHANPSLERPIFPDAPGVGTIFVNGSDGTDDFMQAIELNNLEGGLTFNAGGRPGTVTFAGTDEGNDLRFEGDHTAPGDAVIQTDGEATVTVEEFGSGTVVTLRGEKGDDVISVAVNAATNFSKFIIDGGAPIGGDELRLEGTDGADTFNYTPGSRSTTGANPSTLPADAGMIDFATAGQTVAIDFLGIDDLLLNGLGGEDALTVNEPTAGAYDNIQLFPGLADGGMFQSTALFGTFASPMVFSPVTFASMETRTFNAGTGLDTITLDVADIPGVNNAFEIDASTANVTTIDNGELYTFQHDGDGDLLSMEVGSAADVITVTPGPGIEIAVNTSFDNDLLVYNAGGLPVVLDVAGKRITQTAKGDVTFTSVERIEIEGQGTGASGNTLTINGTSANDRITYQPAPDGGRIVPEGAGFELVFRDVDGTMLIKGGAGVADEVIVETTGVNDTIAIDSPARTVTAMSAGTPLKTVTLDAEVELVTVDGQAGDDTVLVIPTDSGPGGLLVQVNGDWPNAGDRLVVKDEGLGDVVRHHQGADGRSGSVIVGLSSPVAYEAIERVDILPLDPVTGGTGDDGMGRIVVFHADRLEQNDSRLNPTELPDLAESIVKPNIDPGGIVDPFGMGFDLPGDEDWYRYIAPKIGTYRFEVLHEPVGVLSNGQPGLPGDGELMIQMYHADGTPIDKLPVDGPASHTIGVEEGERYLLRVRGVALETINIYDIAVVEVDTLGPQVTDVYLTADPDYDLFDPKPSTDGPTPLAFSLTVRLQDLPERFPGFLYGALDEAIASQPGHYRLVGDHNGVIAISNVVVINDPVVVQEVATASIILGFDEPLPDDRFTLTISDSLTDPPRLNLDGENNAVEPQENPLFPTGDAVPGGDFVARFTIDSRAEIGAWAAGSVYVDTNGNFLFDPQNLDAVNRDITYSFGYADDHVFEGDFAALADDQNTPHDDTIADGFDKLAAYGALGGQFRWAIDNDNDGVADLVVFEGTNIIGMPVAGNFDGSADNGDEVGIYTGTDWYLDGLPANNARNFMISDATPINTTDMPGFPIVGDFDGDGTDDLATYQDGVFYFDLFSIGGYGGLDVTIDLGDANNRFLDFIGVNERPVAADMDGDGIDDVGLWVPQRAGVSPLEDAEWYFLVSGGDYDGQDDYLAPPNGPDGTRGVRVFGTVATLDHAFTPIPFGNDIFAQFGDEFAVPVVGNFDPPVAGSSGGGDTDPDTVVLAGSDDVNDSFELVPGEAGAWTVYVNDVPHEIGAGTSTVLFDGLGGDDTVTFNGTDAVESAELWSDGGEFRGSITVSVSNVESITANMGGGGDSVEMHGSDADAMEELVSWPHSADFTGEGLDLHATGFESLTADPGAGPLDTAFLHGTGGSDHFYTDPAQAKLTDQGSVEYELIAMNFPYAHGYGEGGHDTAEMIDSSGNDSVYAYSNLVKMIGETSFFFRRAKGFAEVTAHSVNGVDPSQWGDAAYLRDGERDDRFTASPDEGKMEYDVASGGATVTVLDFDYVHGYGIHGGTDTAYLSGSPGDDTAISTPWYTKLFNEAASANAFFVRAKYFELVHADAGSDGNDVARMYDSSRRDTFAAGPESASMVGIDYQYSNHVHNFDEVYARANAGGFDTAELVDLAGSKDHLDAGLPRSNPAHWAEVYSDALDYFYRIEGFESAETSSSDANDESHVSPDAEVTDWLLTTGW